MSKHAPKGMNKRYYRSPRKNKDFIGSVISAKTLSEIRDLTYIRGVDISLLLEYLGGDEQQQARDLKDLEMILEMPLSQIEAINQGRRLIAWRDIRKLSEWADIYPITCINILVNNEMPALIDIEYTRIRIDLLEVMRLFDMDPDNLELVLGDNWRNKASRIKAGERKLDSIELCKVADIVGVKPENILKFAGLH